MARQSECGPYLEEFNDVEVLDCGDRRADSSQHAPDDCNGIRFSWRREGYTSYKFELLIHLR